MTYRVNAHTDAQRRRRRRRIFNIGGVLVLKTPPASMPGEHCHTTIHFHMGAAPGIRVIIAMWEYPTLSLRLFLKTSPT